MNNSVFLMIWIIIGLISATVGFNAFYRNSNNTRTLLLSEIEKAEKELTTDIEQIGAAELQQTATGKELLILRGIKSEEITAESEFARNEKEHQLTDLLLKTLQYINDDLSDRKKTLKYELRLMRMQQLAEQQRFQHEQILKAMEVRGQAFGQLAGAIFQMTNTAGGGRRDADSDIRDTLARALEALANMPSISFGTSPLLTLEENEPLSLRDRIIAELQEVQKLSGFESVRVKEIEPGFEQAEIHIQGLHIFIVCDENYPTVPPLKIEAQRSGDLAYKQISLEWTESMDLRQIVLEIASRLLSKKHLNALLKNPKSSAEAE